MDLEVGRIKGSTEFGQSLAELHRGKELEFETALSSFFSHGAKRYVGRVVAQRGDAD